MANARSGREGHKWRQEWSSSLKRRCNEVSLAFSLPQVVGKCVKMACIGQKPSVAAVLGCLCLPWPLM